MSNVTVADVFYQALIDAGPGTEADRTFTLGSVVKMGGPVPDAAIYDRLHE